MPFKRRSTTPGPITSSSSPPPATMPAISRHFPRADRGVIGVSATDQNDALAPTSTFGGSVFLAAPGVSILGTYPNNSYVTWTGTSASAAIVAGTAALMRAVDPSLSNGVVVSRIAESADPAGTQDQTGNGRLNIQRAITDTSTTASNPLAPRPTVMADRLWGRITRRRKVMELEL